ncbi:MAG: glycosyltransferase family 4 protein [Thermoplasmatota archaeon]
MRVVFLYDGPHPMHLAWARSVGAAPVANKFNTRTDAAALRAAGHRGKGRSGGLELLKGMSLRSLGLPASAFLQGLAQAAADIRELDADALIVEGRMGVIPGHLFKKLKGGRTLLILADPFVWELHSFPRGWRRTFESILAGYDGIIAVSGMMRELLPPAAKARARVVHPSFESSYFGLTPSPESKRIAYLGALDERKGVDLSIEAFRLVRRRAPEASFVLIGKGPLRERYEGEPGVEFAGFVEDPGRELQRCALYLHLSRFDPYPVSVLEGMAAGLVPVVSKMTGTRELLEGIDPGLVATGPEDAARRVLALMERPGEIRELSARCREAARGWGKERSVREFQEAFKELVGWGGGGS